MLMNSMDGDDMFRNILVCIDGSRQAEGALSQAIDLAESQNSRLTLLTAVSRPPYWANTPMTAAAVEPIGSELQHEAELTLRAATDRVPAAIPVTTVLSEDPIRDALICQIRTGRYDLVVLGTRGRGALSAAVLGSVSHYALNHSDVPVLIVRTEGEDEPESPMPLEAPAAA
jgi:nucleotide-binding universal stress UspA family protein